VDFASTRTESYSRPGALPEVRVCSDIIVDLERRDFAVNAMAVGLSGRCYGVVVDPFGGAGDLERRQLAVLHPESFEDDPTRILRGVRFAARYGYRFEKHTLGFLKACVAGGCMQTVSGKRVRRELELIFAEENVVAAIRLLEKLQVLRTVDESLSFGAGKVRRLPAADAAARRFGGDEFNPAAYWFGYLFAKQEWVADRLAGYLNLDRRTRSVCLWAAGSMGAASRELASLEAGDSYAVTRLLDSIAVESMALLYAFSRKRSRGLIEMYMTSWRHVRPRLTGADLVALGVKEGRAVGRLLEKIREMKLLGKLPSRRSEAAFVKKEAGVRS
jgi:tRNA nucleotidyltransferase (CCA-adding enzyme)